MSTTDRNFVALTIVVICLLAFFAAAVSNVKRLPIGNDEYNSWNRILDNTTGVPYSLRQTVDDVIAESAQHGPAYFIVLNVWRTLAGSELFTLRLLSVYFGLFTLAVTYRLAASVGGQELGLTAFFIAVFLAYIIYYSHLARMYTLLPMMSGWLLWSYARVIQPGRAPSRIAWLTLLLSAALLLYIHYFGIMLLAALGIYHLVVAKKNRRWLKVALLMVAAGLLFLPWLPVAVLGFPGRPDVADTRLPLLGSLLHILRIFSNGLIIIPPLALGAAAVRYRRLKPGELFLVFVAVVTLLLILLSNELAAIFSEWQMRYMSVFVLPFCCALAIGLRLLPGWNILRLPLAAVWIASFVIFYRSEDLLVATGARIQNLDKIPRYQDFIYESDSLPGYNELILSVHPDTAITVRKTLDYYRKALSRWSHIVHISRDEANEAVIQSGLSTYSTLDAIAANANGIWLIYNPQQTNLSSMPLYTDWMAERFELCKRFLDKSESVIEYVLSRDFPCELITDSRPFAVDYDGGTQLANYEVERSSDSLNFYFWWRRTIGKDYSLSLQVFDVESNKVLWLDAVISGEPLDQFAFDISELAGGEYVVKLIVYNFVTIVSQGGTVVAEQRRFDRDLELLRFTVD